MKTYLGVEHECWLSPAWLSAVFYSHLGWRDSTGDPGREGSLNVVVLSVAQVLRAAVGIPPRPVLR